MWSVAGQSALPSDRVVQRGEVELYSIQSSKSSVFWSCLAVPNKLYIDCAVVLSLSLSLLYLSSLSLSLCPPSVSLSVLIIFSYVTNTNEFT